jgi:HD-GYP domain-containing protein (c-di-GMP phosphodiesterase class II)
MHKQSANCDPASYSEYPDLIPVKVRSLFPVSRLPCDLYFPSLFEEQIRLEKMMSRGELYLEHTHRTFLEEDIDIVYIKTVDEPEFLEYLLDGTQEAVKSQETSAEKKTQLLYDGAEAVVKKVFREHPNEPNIASGKRVIEHLAAHTATGQVAVPALLRLFSKDYYTFSHCVQVATLGMFFGGFLGWSKQEIRDFGFGALFHDLGKNSISDNILNKPGKLEGYEFEIIKQHPLTGYRQLKQTRAFSRDQLDTILYHHEAMDGSGYPDGLTANDIPRYARVARIIDVFDALTSARVYRPALSRQDALALMRNEMHASFDAELLDVFSRYVGGGDSLGDSPDSELKAGVGTLFSIQCEASGKRAKAILIGMEAKDFIVLKLSDTVQAEAFHASMPVVVRYFYGGEAYGFEAQILEVVKNPVPMVVVTYPGQVEKMSLRCERRHECFLPSTIEFRGRSCRCVTANISYQGCRVFVKHPESEISRSVVKDDPIVVCTALPGRARPVYLRGLIKNKEETAAGDFMGIQFAVMEKQSADDWKAFIDDILELTR